MPIGGLYVTDNDNSLAAQKRLRDGKVVGAEKPITI